MGRTHHLVKTLHENLKWNEGVDVEFVLLDYNSKDGLEDWARENLSGLMDEGKVSYWRERIATRWKMPHAKNLAHLLASGELLCNLDADNYTGPAYAKRLKELFEEKGDRLVTHVHGGSFGGRIAVLSKNFRKLRGYDEQLSYGWGWEDDDFKARGKAIGLEIRTLQVPGDGAIEHPDEERVRFMPEWKTMREAHKGQSLAFQKRGAGGINPSGYGKAVVYKGFSDRPIEWSDLTSRF